MNNDTIRTLVRNGFRLIGSTYRRERADGTHETAVSNGTHVTVMQFDRGIPLMIARDVFHEVDQCDDLHDFLRNTLDDME